MKAYMTAWRGAVEPHDATGIAIFTCSDKEVKLRMNDFEQYLALCEVIDAVANKAKQRTKASIFDHMNSFKEL